MNDKDWSVYLISLSIVRNSSIPFFFFFFNDTATTEIYTLSLHDALPISRARAAGARCGPGRRGRAAQSGAEPQQHGHPAQGSARGVDRLSVVSGRRAGGAVLEARRRAGRPLASCRRRFRRPEKALEAAPLRFGPLYGRVP